MSGSLASPQSATKSATGVEVVFDRIGLAFDGRVLLSDFNLQVARGERVILTGPSGCGKSTLLRCLLGFQVPTEGRIHIGGTELCDRSVWSLRHRIAAVAQEPDLGEEGTVREWIDELLALQANREARKNSDRIPDELRRLGLSEEILTRSGRDCSGGEKQRIALCLALLLNRDLLLLDEPTSALDAETRQRVFARLSELDGATLLMISHEASAHLDFADRIVSLDQRENAHGRH